MLLSAFLLEWIDEYATLTKNEHPSLVDSRLCGGNNELILIE